MLRALGLRSTPPSVRDFEPSKTGGARMTAAQADILFNAEGRRAANRQFVDTWAAQIKGGVSPQSPVPLTIAASTGKKGDIWSATPLQAGIWNAGLNAVEQIEALRDVHNTNGVSHTMVDSMGNNTAFFLADAKKRIAAAFLNLEYTLKQSGEI